MIRFIEWQCLVLSPICPHVSDFIWTESLNKGSFILKAAWPAVGSVDEAGETFDMAFLLPKLRPGLALPIMATKELPCIAAND